MDRKALYEKISDLNFNLKRVLGNTSAPGGMIEQAKNILYNNIDAIEESLKYAADAEMQIKVLELELSDAERELDEIKNGAEKKSIVKRKKAPAEGNE